MQKDTEERVFVWWNTGLSPPVPKTRATEADMTFVVEQIRAMRQSTDFDFLALGEVASTDLTTILAALSEPALTLCDTTKKDGRLIFDTAILYNADKLALLDHQSLIDNVGSKRLKVGEAFLFWETHTGLPLLIVVSHWLSRITAPELSSFKMELGTALRRGLASFKDAASHVILMGDYNDEPFSPSLEKHVLATRDRSLARRKNYFYNPFWKVLVASKTSGGFISVLSQGRPPEENWFIAARNPKAEDPQWVALAKWEQPTCGYPCMLSYDKQQIRCHDQEALERAIAELLASVWAGRKIRGLLDQP